MAPKTATDESSSAVTAPKRPSRRRTTSNLGGDPRGDTGANSVSTSPQEEQSLNNRQNDKRNSKRRKDRSLLARWKAVSLRHTWLNPLVAIIVILALFAINPTESNILYPCIFLSYPLARNDPFAADNYMRPYWRDTTQYGKGAKDFAFVGFYMIVLSFTREFLMQRAIRPLAIWLGIRRKEKQSRFMEQAYTAVYFAVFGPFGLYVMSRSPVWYFNTTAFFEGFPHRAHEGYFKAYYLLQASYWAQQGVVLMLQLEKPRKDFNELVAHHVITVALIWLSYRFHFTYMGIAVYITHDISDFFLATSKMLNYIDSFITPVYFGSFVCIWAYCRHYLNLRILWATLTEFSTVGPFEINWETQQYKCLLSQVITFALLASLQAVNMFWFILILRILKNYVITKVATDERSDYGDDDEDAEDEDSTDAKRERMGLAVDVVERVDADVDPAASPAASTRSKARSSNGHALSPSPEEPASKSAGGSTRRRRNA